MVSILFLIYTNYLHHWLEFWKKRDKKEGPVPRGPPAIHIGILNFSLFPDHPSFYREYLLTDTKTGQIFTRNYSLRVLELNQLEKATAEEKSSDLYQWAMLFKAQTWEEIRMLSKNESIFNETADYLRQLSADEKIRLQCEARERNLRDRRSEIRAGREAGLQEGLQQKAKKAAINMAAKNIPLEDIAEILEVSLDEVRIWTSGN